MCSDYDGTRSTIDAANNGLDIAMPGPPSRPDYFGAPLLAAIKSGRVSEATITEKAVRVVYSLAAVGALDAHNNNSSDTDVTSDEHRALARKLASASATLLRNRAGALPLDAANLGAAGSLALIGLAARDGAIYGGGGSGSVVAKAPVSVYEALMAKLGTTGTGQAFRAANCSVVDPDTDYFAGAGKSTRVPMPASPSVATCCAACTAGSGPWKRFTFTLAFEGGGPGCWCHPAAVSKVAKKGFMSGACSAPPMPPTPPGPVTYSDGTDLAAAVANAKAAKVAIVVIAQSSHENADRVNMSLGQSDVVASVARAQPNTIVVAVSPGPFLTPWREEVAAILVRAPLCGNRGGGRTGQGRPFGLSGLGVQRERSAGVSACLVCVCRCACVLCACLG